MQPETIIKVGDLVKLKNPPPSGHWSDPNRIYLVTRVTENTARVYGFPGGRFKTNFEVISENFEVISESR